MVMILVDYCLLFYDLLFTYNPIRVGLCKLNYIRELERDRECTLFIVKLAERFYSLDKD